MPLDQKLPGSGNREGDHCLWCLAAPATIRVRTRSEEIMMRKVVTLMVVLLCAGAQWCVSQAAPKVANLAGEWNGTLDANGTKLRLVLKVSKSGDGKLSATIDSPDQNATGIPVSLVDQTGDAVKRSEEHT